MIYVISIPWSYYFFSIQILSLGFLISIMALNTTYSLIPSQIASLTIQIIYPVTSSAVLLGGSLSKLILQNKTFNSSKHHSKNILLFQCSPFQLLEPSFTTLHRSKTRSDLQFFLTPYHFQAIKTSCGGGLPPICIPNPNAFSYSIITSRSKPLLLPRATQQHPY